MNTVIQLYIDDGVSSRGHRDNQMSTSWDVTGVGYDCHNTYGNVAVFGYASADHTTNESELECTTTTTGGGSTPEPTGAVAQAGLALTAYATLLAAALY